MYAYILYNHKQGRASMIRKLNDIYIGLHAIRCDHIMLTYINVYFGIFRRNDL